MIDKTLIKSILNPRLKSIDEYVDKNILKDPIDNLMKQYSFELQDYDYIDSVELFSILTLKGSMKYINRYDKKIRTGSRKINDHLYLHRKCIPLDEVNFDIKTDQPNMFNNECEGMCGV
jgi:cyclopropane fatty-acyl-phospholipid synthase-like methyltransferase